MEKENTNKLELMDKAFSRLLIPSMCAIFICIICLCSTTFAWFTESVPSEGNQINIAENCNIDVTVEKDGVVFTDIESGVELEANVEYTVTVTLPPDTASGYCVMTADGVTYKSDYILRHTGPESKVITFTVMVEETKTVEFIGRWGIYNGESDVVDNKLIIPKNID